MLTSELILLAATAASIGCGHALLGPDHYLPFVALSAARRWSMARTLATTALCGIGHVIGSIVLGVVGIALGSSVQALAGVEAVRGAVAAWMLTAFGVCYAAWGLRHAAREHAHVHEHVHADGTRHSHRHDHHRSHAHPHVGEGASLAPWVLFTVFVFGPCEPLIPVLMYPAAHASFLAAAFVAAVFALATIATMCLAVWVLRRGAALAWLNRAPQFRHAFAGTAIAACGLGILLLGW